MKEIMQTDEGNQLERIRTETVLSKFPIHNLSQRDSINIHITRENENGEVDLLWEVSPNRKYGDPRQLAYKLDTLVINQRLDELPRPLPRVVKIGSLRQLRRELGADERYLKKALQQNATVSINAKLTYKDRDKAERYIDATFTRYGVVFTGKKLPDGQKADGIYITLNDPYYEVLNHAPVRPLDYDYLKQLPPVAQRFYEDISYKMFAAIKYKRATAKLVYSEFCTIAPQRRYHNRERVQKQMYKVHRPHLKSGYISKVKWEKFIDADGKPDWVVYYTIGPKARREYKAFNVRQAKKLELETQNVPEVASEPEFTDLAQDLYDCGIRPKSKAMELTKKCSDERVRQWIELHKAGVIGSAGLNNALENDWVPNDNQLEQIKIWHKDKQAEGLKNEARKIRDQRIQKVLKSFPKTKEAWADYRAKQYLEQRRRVTSPLVTAEIDPEKVRQDALAEYPETEEEKLTLINQRPAKYGIDLEEIENELQAKNYENDLR